MDTRHIWPLDTYSSAGGTRNPSLRGPQAGLTPPRPEAVQTWGKSPAPLCPQEPNFSPPLQPSDTQGQEEVGWGQKNHSASRFLLPTDSSLCHAVMKTHFAVMPKRGIKNFRAKPSSQSFSNKNPRNFCLTHQTV